MDKKKLAGLAAIVLALVLIVGGAAMLYPRLGDLFAGSQLVKYGEAKQLGKGETVKADIPEDKETEENENTDNKNVGTATENKAPDITVYDGDGNAVRLSDFEGKPVVLNFWASWCGPCKSEMPDFDKKYLELGKDIHFLMVNMTSGRETVADAKSFIKDSGYSFPVYYDTDHDAAITYSVSSIPTTIFIDKNGCLVAYANGSIDGETLSRGIDMIK